MANKTTKTPATPMDKMITAVTVVVILVVLGLAVVAGYGKISQNLGPNAIEKEKQAIENGEQEATVRYIASSLGMETGAFLEQYGLSLGDGLKETSTEREMILKFTVENYYKYIDSLSGQTTDLNAVLASWNADELGITKDTVWSEVEEKVTYLQFEGEENYNAILEQYSMYGYDMSVVNTEMTIEEFSDAMTKLMNAGPTGTMAPELVEQMEASAEATETTETAAETTETAAE